MTIDHINHVDNRDVTVSIQSSNHHKNIKLSLDCNRPVNSILESVANHCNYHPDQLVITDSIDGSVNIAQYLDGNDHFKPVISY